MKILKNIFKEGNIKFVIAGATVFLAVVLVYVSIRICSVYGNKIITIDVKGRSVYAEVVSSEEKRRVGLGGRQGICSSCGMLFEFQKTGRYSFWMKNMKFPLDIVWIDDGIIVHIEKNIEPTFKGSLVPSEDAEMVLEINAGKAEEWGIETGDTLIL